MSDDAMKDLFGPQMKKQVERTDECLNEIVARLVGHEFEVLAQGYPTIVKARIKQFGEVGGGKAGIDVTFSDGGYLELFITRTGWGSPVVNMPIAASDPEPSAKA